MSKKREDQDKVNLRVKKYRQEHCQLVINVSKDDKDLFGNIKGLEGLSYSKKLSELMKFWNKSQEETKIEQVKKPQQRSVLGVIVTDDTFQVKQTPEPIVKKAEIKVEPQKKSLKIENWNKFIIDFNDFLFNFKSANRLRPRLRTHGQTIKDDMDKHPEFKASFNKICERLPESIVKNFKPMFRQGYFYLYEEEIIEIASFEIIDELFLLLYESLRNMYKDNPVKEAKKILGLT